jgi:hypothetical protein
MKVISPIFSSMRGKLGGAVGAVSRGGVAYLRSLVIPGNPRTLFQTTVRLVLTSLAAAWKSILNDSQRAAWAAIAGATSSGIDAYVKANTQLILGGGDRVDAAPDSLALVTTPITSVAVDASAHTVTPTGGGLGTDIDYNLFVSRSQFSSRLAQQFNFTFAGHMEEGDTLITLDPTHPAYNLVEGDVVYVRIVQYGNNGGDLTAQVAPAQEFRVIVAA